MFMYGFFMRPLFTIIAMPITLFKGVAAFDSSDKWTTDLTTPMIAFTVNRLRGLRTTFRSSSTHTRTHDDDINNNDNTTIDNALGSGLIHNLMAITSTSTYPPGVEITSDSLYSTTYGNVTTEMYKQLVDAGSIESPIHGGYNARNNEYDGYLNIEVDDGIIVDDNGLIEDELVVSDDDDVRQQQLHAQPVIRDIRDYVNLRGRKPQQLRDGEVYIGRRQYQGGWRLADSKWANPYKMKDYAGREQQCLDDYEEYIRSNPHLCNSLRELDSMILACWCKPKRCHAEILIKLHNEICLGRGGIFGYNSKQ